VKVRSSVPVLISTTGQVLTESQGVADTAGNAVSCEILHFSRPLYLRSNQVGGLVETTGGLVGGKYPARRHP
jgi:hypothetical protein